MYFIVKVGKAKKKKKCLLLYKNIPEAYSKPSLASKMELFAKIVYVVKLITIFANCCILLADWVLQGPVNVVVIFQKDMSQPHLKVISP